MVRTAVLCLILATCLIQPSIGSAAMSIHETKLSLNQKQGFVTLKDLLKFQKKNSSKLNATCAEVAELSGSLLCAFKSTRVMNESLLRISFYTGTVKGFPKGTLVSNNNRILKKLNNEIAGHAVTIEDSLPFFHAAQSSGDKDTQLKTYESDFLESIVQHPKLAQAHGQFSIIAFPVGSADVATVVRHEINHAKYYLDSNYREAVNQFWFNSVSASDKSQVNATLSSLYNTKNVDTIIDEFQAYLMEGDTAHNPLRSLIRKYKDALLWLIRQRGSEPVANY